MSTVLSNPTFTTTNARYTVEFYERQRAGSLRSARVIVPLILSRFAVASVVDVGCGVGTWLRAFQENGIEDVQGYDGDYVDRSTLFIPAERFGAADLRSAFMTRRRFDLAISMEVAEHVPDAHALTFVRRLTAAAPLVLFSAAVPGQGGVDHINEQWQDYWRSIFAALNYQPVDLVRPAVWGNESVEYWYQQNTILYVSSDRLETRPDIVPVPDGVSLNVVHPRVYEAKLHERDLGARDALKLARRLCWDALRRRLKRGGTSAT